jgi:hypothetical protein
VVVSGVLVALALQAAYQARQDAAAEKAYLTQLTKDLRETGRTLQEALDQDIEHKTTNAELLAALYRPEPLELASARLWFKRSTGWFSDPRPVLGTIDTLIATGDIGLIRDPELRSRIMAYASLVTSDMAELNRSVDRLTGANDAERKRLELIGLPPVEEYSEEQMSSLFPRYLSSWSAMQSDPDLRVVYQIRLISYFNRIFYLERLKTATSELQAMVDRQD